MNFTPRKKNERSSPLKEHSLPQAGESLTRAWDELFDAKIGYWFIMIAIFGVLAALEWVRHWMKSPPTPWLATIFFLVALLFGSWRIVTTWAQLKRMGLGIRGERTVGQMLETLHAAGFRVFHDIEEDGFNIDHVIVGPRGIFAIETKTISKRAGNPSVSYDGHRLLVDGMEMDRDPIAQVKAAARSVADYSEDERP